MGQMNMLDAVAQRLYLRIWLAVVGGMAVLTLAVGWAWSVAQEYQAQQARQAAAAEAGMAERELVLTDASGAVVVQGSFERRRQAGGPPVLWIEAADGSSYRLEMRSTHAEGRGGHRAGPPVPNGQWDFWMRPPFGFVWMLALVGVAVALGVFPIIRKLLMRLEKLQHSVRRFGQGDLRARASEAGRDEVAELARQFNAAAAQIEALVQSHKTLLANASHELRSPLARIRMGLELMRATERGSAQQEAAAQEIVLNLSELDQLVDEILLASRLDFPDADIGAMEAVELIGLCAEECARVGAEIAVELADDGGEIGADDAGLQVVGSARLLRRAIRNLLENARRYSAGAVELRLRTRGQWAEICVEDHGLGVPAEQRERIFEKFYRLPGASEKSGGVGLGLALVRSIAQRHGGQVHCRAREDGQNGAAFILELPTGK